MEGAIGCIYICKTFCQHLEACCHSWVLCFWCFWQFRRILRWRSPLCSFSLLFQSLKLKRRVTHIWSHWDGNLSKSQNQAFVEFLNAKTTNKQIAWKCIHYLLRRCTAFLFWSPHWEVHSSECYIWLALSVLIVFFYNSKKDSSLDDLASVTHHKVSFVWSLYQAALWILLFTSTICWQAYTPLSFSPFSHRWYET